MSIENRKVFASWGIAQLATAGYAVLAVMIAAMALAAWFATGRIEASFDAYRNEARATVASAQAMDMLGEAQTADLLYRLHPSAEEAAAFDAAAAELVAHLPQLAAHTADDDALSAQVQAAAAATAAYREAFSGLIARQDQRAATQTALAAAAESFLAVAHEIEQAAVTGGATAALGASTAIGQFHTVETLLAGVTAASRDIVALEAADRLDAVAAWLEEASLRTPFKTFNAATAALEGYRAAVERLIETDRAIGGLVANALEPAARAVHDAIDGVLSEQIAAQNRLGPQTREGIALASSMAVALGVLSLFVAAGLAVLATWRTRYSLSGITAKMERLAAGDLDVEIYETGRDNELGRMAKALETFRENALAARAAAEAESARNQSAQALQVALGRVVAAAGEGDFSARIAERFGDAEFDNLAEAANALMGSVESGLAEAGRVLEALARRDLSCTMDGAYRGAFARLQGDINTTVRTMGEVLGELAAVSADVDAAAQEIASGARTVSTQAEQQAAALEETAAAMEQISASVATTAAGSREAAGMSNKAAGRAEEGVRIVAGVDTAMREIETGSEKVKEIISAIDSIAFTTNLLALNASVEAARAGEAGKGFAVVASEVRSLAQRSADAAGEIRRLIEASGASVVAGVDRVREAREALDKIMEGVAAVEGSIRDISTAAGEQASGVAEVTRRLQGMDQITQSNAAMAEESAANASELVNLSTRLRDLSQSFAGVRADAATRRRAA